MQAIPIGLYVAGYDDLLVTNIAYLVESEVSKARPENERMRDIKSLNW